MRLFVFLMLIVINSKLKCQTINIPNGVVYKYANEGLNKIAKDAVIKELTNDSFVLFNKMLTIGPNLWSRIKSLNHINEIEGGNIIFELPVINDKGKTIAVNKLNGKLIQTPSDYKKIISVLKNNYFDKKVSFRKLMPNELNYYWSTISFDIEEPIFVVESKNLNFVFDLEIKNGKVYLTWLDIL